LTRGVDQVLHGISQSGLRNAVRIAESGTIDFLQVILIFHVQVGLQGVVAEASALLKDEAAVKMAHDAGLLMLTYGIAKYPSLPLSIQFLIT
jgi:hypothetical protein